MAKTPRLTGGAVMNVHHLELFYYVARHGGISSAVRHMPYGIQQPAVSAQILRLEKDLGVKLFERQPFRLTVAGRQLMEFVDPFFSNMEAVAHRLKNDAQPQLRVAASAAGSITATSPSKTLAFPATVKVNFWPVFTSLE